jgi:hypothetical protein
VPAGQHVLPITQTPRRRVLISNVARRTLIQALAVHAVPFSFVESDLFQEFLCDLGVEGDLPSRRTLTRDLDTIHQELLDFIKQQLRDRISPLAYQLDFWESQSDSHSVPAVGLSRGPLCLPPLICMGSVAPRRCREAHA